MAQQTPQAGSRELDAGERARWADVIRAFANLRAQNGRAIATFGHVNGVNASDVRGLGYVQLRGRATPTEVAEHLRLTPGAMTTLADRLEAAGLIMRVQNPADRRSILLEVTPRGTDALARADVIYQDAFAAVLGADHPPEWYEDRFLALAARLEAIADGHGAAPGGSAD